MISTGNRNWLFCKNEKECSFVRCNSHTNYSWLSQYTKVGLYHQFKSHKRRDGVLKKENNSYRNLDPSGSRQLGRFGESETHCKGPKSCSSNADAEVSWLSGFDPLLYCFLLGKVYWVSILPQGFRKIWLAWRKEGKIQNWRFASFTPFLEVSWLSGFSTWFPRRRR